MNDHNSPGPLYDVPVVCDECGSFFPSGVAAANTAEMFISGSVGPCPVCGGYGHIPEGLYSFGETGIELIQGSASSISDLRRLAALLGAARERQVDAEDVRRTIAREVPELRSLADLLPKTGNELYAFLSLLVAILALIVSAREKGDTPTVKVDQIVKVLIEQGPSSADRVPLDTVSRPKRGRNDPCACGSGKKSKKCHPEGLRK